MITVRLLGGAKRSAGSERVEIDAESASVGEILAHIAALRPDGAPALDARNVLVAINGADSSALAEPVARSGDEVSVIPIVHGGRRRAVFAAGRASAELWPVRVGRAEDPAEIIDSLRAAHRRLAVQLVWARCILGRGHAERIVGISLAAQRRGALLARRLESDMLMRIAGSTQISAAIGLAGARAGADSLLIAAGPRRALDALDRDIAGRLGGAALRADNSAFLRRRFGITAAHLASALSARPLEDILVERAAVMA